MNLTLDKAIEVTNALTDAGYNVSIEVLPQRDNFQILGHKGSLCRVSVQDLSYEDFDLRALCDLAESVGLHCRYSLGAIRFETEARHP